MGGGELLAQIEDYLRFLEAVGVKGLPRSEGVVRFLSLDLSRAARTLPELHREIVRCTRCRLHRTRTRAVPGEGPLRARLVLVGEAPGREEDLEGRPFVGRAGRLLDQMLAAVKIRRSEVYITNVVKCRPPGNRTPEPEEVEACLPFLWQQLKLLGPKIVCTLGLVSAQALLATDAPLSRLRGRIHEREGLKVLPTFHPAFLLRHPERKREAWEDLKVLRRLYQEEAA